MLDMYFWQKPIELTTLRLKDVRSKGLNDAEPPDNVIDTNILDGTYVFVCSSNDPRVPPIVKW